MIICGLTDFQNLELGTDPSIADTSMDGITDLEAYLWGLPATQAYSPQVEIKVDFFIDYTSDDSTWVAEINVVESPSGNPIMHLDRNAAGNLVPSTPSIEIKTSIDTDPVVVSLNEDGKQQIQFENYPESLYVRFPGNSLYNSKPVENGAPVFQEFTNSIDATSMLQNFGISSDFITSTPVENAKHLIFRKYIENTFDVIGSGDNKIYKLSKTNQPDKLRFRWFQELSEDTFGSIGYSVSNNDIIFTQEEVLTGNFDDTIIYVSHTARNCPQDSSANMNSLDMSLSSTTEPVPNGNGGGGGPPGSGPNGGDSCNPGFGVYELSKEDFLTFWLSIKLRPWVDILEAPSPLEILDNTYGRSQLLHKINLSDFPESTIFPFLRNIEIPFVEIFARNDLDRLVAEFQALFMIEELLEELKSILFDKFEGLENFHIPEWLESTTKLIQHTVISSKLADWLVSLQTRLSVATERGFPTPQAPVYDHSNKIDEDQTFLEFLWSKAVEVAEKVVEVIEEGVDVLQQFHAHVRSTIIDVYDKFVVGTFTFVQGLWDGFVENVVEPAVEFVNNVVESTVGIFTDIIEKAVTGGLDKTQSYIHFVRTSLILGIAQIRGHFFEDLVSNLDLTLIKEEIDNMSNTIATVLGPFNDILGLFDIPMGIMDRLPGIFKELLNYIGPGLYLNLLIKIFDEIFTQVILNFIDLLPMDQISTLTRPLFIFFENNIEHFDIDINISENENTNNISEMFRSIGSLLDIVENSLDFMNQIFDVLLNIVKNMNTDDVIFNIFIDFISTFIGGVLFLLEPSIDFSELNLDSSSNNNKTIEFSDINYLNINFFVLGYQSLDGIHLTSLAIVAGILEYGVKKLLEGMPSQFQNNIRFLALALQIDINILRLYSWFLSLKYIDFYGEEYSYIEISLRAIGVEALADVFIILTRNVQNIEINDVSLEIPFNSIGQAIKNILTIIGGSFSLVDLISRRNNLFPGETLSFISIFIFQIVQELLEGASLINKWKFNTLKNIMTKLESNKISKFILDTGSNFSEVAINILFAANVGH
jgi:hypothetical protein